MAPVRTGLPKKGSRPSSSDSHHRTRETKKKKKKKNSLAAADSTASGAAFLTIEIAWGGYVLIHDRAASHRVECPLVLDCPQLASAPRRSRGSSQKLSRGLHEARTGERTAGALVSCSASAPGTPPPQARAPEPRRDSARAARPPPASAAESRARRARAPRPRPPRRGSCSRRSCRRCSRSARSGRPRRPPRWRPGTSRRAPNPDPQSPLPRRSSPARSCRSTGRNP
mmetsp:Transcript_47127/g.125912  ORF Transcript_47127/g.125912 Transcript_47127/m.125912 type:complete len:227 (-) Transcript_47127:1856-2536(-)